MSRRFLTVSALVSATVMIVGLLILDIPLALEIHGSSFENLPFFVDGLEFLGMILGMNVWYWLAASSCVSIGLIGVYVSRITQLSRRFALAILAAGLVQALTLGMMILGKNTFGRLRPMQVLESGDWSVLWFAGGGSFPSGHGAFFFGLFFPLAASAPRLWQRMTLIAFPLFAGCARLDMAKHFLSDVACSALIAACMALLIERLMRRWQPKD